MSKADYDKLMVNLWVAGTVDNQRNGGWSSHLHCIIQGQNFNKIFGGYGKETTVTRMTLLAVLEGLRALKPGHPVFVKIYTTVHQVTTGLNKNMYKWVLNAWLTSKGEPPQHMDLWQEIYSILNDPTRVLTYKVIPISSHSIDAPYRLMAMHKSAEYLAAGKRDRYEVSIT